MCNLLPESVFEVRYTFKEVIIMITCPHCGTQSPDYYTQCPNCGGAISGASPQQPVQQPFQQPATTGGYIPPAYQQEPVTSMGAWFGWSLIIGLLPVIGTIIMLCCVKDPSAKNYAKMALVLQCIALVIYIIAFACGFMSGLAQSLYGMSAFI
jgi:rRNA maturation protein Nop10